jgi:hypothetical protein
MSTRHEIDGATPGRTVYDAAEVYDLTLLEVAKCMKWIKMIKS